MLLFIPIPTQGLPLFPEKKVIIFISYRRYTCYRMNTTIQISKEAKTMISSFGSKEDTYEDIIRRMYRFAVKEQLRELLMSSENTMSLKEARKEHAKLWQK
jgi:predicted CopG family antitoxin